MIQHASLQDLREWYWLRHRYLFDHVELAALVVLLCFHAHVLAVAAALLQIYRLVEGLRQLFNIFHFALLELVIVGTYQTRNAGLLSHVRVLDVDSFLCVEGPLGVVLFNALGVDCLGVAAEVAIESTLLRLGLLNMAACGQA